MSTASATINLGRLALQFGRVDRVTYHEDGVTPESDTDHTVMLGLIACALAPQIRADLDVGLVAQYAFVHDLVEVYAGDTCTLRALDADAKADKDRREQLAYLRIAEEFAMSMPWLVATIADYESRRTPEARYVKALDKLLPKITHILNDAAVIREQGVPFDELRRRYEVQVEEMRAYAADFPALFDLRQELVTRVLMSLRQPEEATR
jgi:putative hydrolases of HD superfamily